MIGRRLHWNGCKGERKRKMINEPAFARPSSNNGFCEGHEGMSIRDYFAAKALQAIVSQTFKYETEDTSRTWDDYYSKIVEHAYKIADAMLKERSA